MQSTLPDSIEHWAERFPNRAAIHFEGQAITWSQFREQVQLWRDWLAHLGVGPGDRVAVCLLNRPEFFYVEFATYQLGAVILPLNVRLAPAEADTILQDAEVKVSIYEEHLGRLASFFANDWNRGTAIEVSSASPADLAPAEYIRRKLDETAALMYTSGTTGKPKGVILTFGNLEASRTLWNLEYGLAHDDVHLVIMPLCFAGGFIASAKHAIASGGTVVLVRSFTAEDVLRLIETYGVTWITSVPTLLGRLVDIPQWEETDLSTLRGIQSGGTPVPPTLIEAYSQRKIIVSQAYGLTEAAAGPAMWMDDQMAHEKNGSVGRKALGFHVSIVTEDGSPAAPGEVGELLLQGPQVSPGYWNRPDETAETFQNGWLHTGDLAYRDPDGYFYLVGRKKEMIVTGGLNVYPAEIENVLQKRPEVSDVAVVGVPSQKWGEAVVACVTPEPNHPIDADELRTFARTQLADYKVPKEILFFDDLPRTLSSKKQRFAIREQAINRLAMQDEGAEG